MPTLTLTLPRPHKAQARVMREARRFNVLACGRRWGKSTLLLDRLIQPALAGQPVGWFAPTYRMLAETWRDGVRLLRPVTARLNASEHRLELITGGVVDMWSLDSPDVARGRKYQRIAVDEAAMVRELQEAWSAVLRPTLADYEGDAWFGSTPKGLNYFYTLWQQGNDPAFPDWQSWQQPTHANPFIPPGEIAALQAELPERTFAQEVLAQFLDSGGGTFRRVLDAATARPGTPTPGHSYLLGIDWAKTQDWTVICVLDTTTHTQVEIDRFQQIDYSLQLTRVMGMAARWRPTAIVAEANNVGGELISQLAKRGLPMLPITTSNASKAVWVDQLALALEQSQLTLLAPDTSPAAAAQLAELLAFEGTDLPSGLVRYAAPPGQHDDTVLALLLAWHGACVPPAPPPLAAGARVPVPGLRM